MHRLYLILPRWDLVVLKLEPMARSLGGWSYAHPPCAGAQSCHSLTSTKVSGEGGRAICIIPSLSIRKNVFWQDKNTICSDNYLTQE